MPIKMIGKREIKIQLNFYIPNCGIVQNSFWTGVCKLNVNDFFQYSFTATTRGHAYKLFKPRCTSGVRRNFFFTERVINPWNSLPPTVSFTSLSSFQQTMCNVDFSSFVSYH